MISKHQVKSLRTLAARWMEHAADPIMEERRRQWRAIKDLKAEKPMILVETCMLPDYIGQDELVCEDPYLRNIEKSLYEIVRHADEIGDDIVVDPVLSHSLGAGNRRLWCAHRGPVTRPVATGATLATPLTLACSRKPTPRNCTCATAA